MESYPDALYRVAGLAAPVEGLDAIGDAEIESFHRDGYLAVEGALAPREVAAALEALLALIDGRVPDYRGLQFEPAAGEPSAASTQEERQDRVRKFWQFVDHSPELRALAAHPGLLDVLTRMMGDAPALYQDMALIKPPWIGSEKPWHQDHAYFDAPLGTCIVGVWIALDDATVENGCMHVVPGSHLGGPIVHFQRRDWQICDSDANPTGAVAVPLRPGGCLFFHCLLHHGTPANHSPHRRRALQYHYRPSGAGRISTEERLAVFGSEGKDVSC